MGHEIWDEEKMEGREGDLCVILGNMMGPLLIGRIR